MFYLVTFKSNYTDEFDVSGFQVMDQKELDEFDSTFSKIVYPIEVHFGSNEGMKFFNKEEFRECFSVDFIDVQIYNFFKNRFRYGFGFIPDTTGYVYYEGEEDN